MIPDVPLLPREHCRFWRTQVRVLTFVAIYEDVHGRPPTIKEIADSLSLPWVVTVARALRRLEDKGLVTWEPGRTRTVRVI